MQRRNFIRLSGGSMAALLFSRFPATANQLINLPDEVWFQSKGEWILMKSAGPSEWKYNDVVVTLQHDPDTLPVLIESPSQSLEAVRLLWKYPTPSSSVCLGDHWERTYGDMSWKSPSFVRKAPWYLMVYDGQQTQCFGIRTGCHSICYWQADNQTLQLTMDTRSGGNGVQLGSRRLVAAEILTSKSDARESPFETARRFCKMMCPMPQLPALPVYGINDWYFAYGNNSKELILQHSNLLANLATDNHNRPFSVVDAGWTLKSPLAENDCCWGDDFSLSNKKFGDMSVLAAEIKKIGMRPGLWVRPLSAGHLDKKNLLMPTIKGRNNPAEPILDPTLPENLERIRNLITLYKQWGYEMVKHDYTSFDIFGRWGFEMTDGLTENDWHFQDTGKTNAEIIIELYKTIRDAAAGIYIIGCNTMSHLSAGFFELNRIGDDTSGQDWQRTRKMGINTLGFRIVQHQAFYSTDGDCVGMTDKVPWSKNKQWMQLLAESSTPLFISAQPSSIGQEQRDLIKKCFTLAATTQPVGEPMDWLTNSLPAHWKLNGRETRFNWD